MKNLAIWHLLLSAVINKGQEMATCSSRVYLGLPQSPRSFLCYSANVAVGTEALFPNKMLFLPEDNAGHPVTEAWAGCGEVVEIKKLTRALSPMLAAVCSIY